MHMGMRN
jgi:hypothetical protein